MKTLLEICQQIGKYPNSEFKNNIQTMANVSSEQLNALNLALRVLWQSESWEFREDEISFDTVSGQKYYTWINNIEEDGVLIDGSSLTYQEKLRNETESTGTPTKYCKEKSQLRLYPTPDSTKAVTVWFYTDYSVKENDDSLKMSFTLEDDVLNVPEYLEGIFIDCLAFLTSEILNADQTDEDYLEHKLRYQESFKLLKSSDTGTADNPTEFII